jgi:hypothetical protein
MAVKSNSNPADLRRCLRIGRHSSPIFEAASRFKPALPLGQQAHPYFADISPHDAFRDPFVFLLHSNVDRIYAMWQCDPAHPERLDRRIPQ